MVGKREILPTTVNWKHINSKQLNKSTNKKYIFQYSKWCRNGTNMVQNLGHHPHGVL